MSKPNLWTGLLSSLTSVFTFQTGPGKAQKASGWGMDRTRYQKSTCQLCWKITHLSTLMRSEIVTEKCLLFVMTSWSICIIQCNHSLWPIGSTLQFLHSPTVCHDGPRWHNGAFFWRKKTGVNFARMGLNMSRLHWIVFFLTAECLETDSSVPYFYLFLVRWRAKHVVLVMS